MSEPKLPVGIHPARDGGYVVYVRDYARQGFEQEAAFAGCLTDCLAYVRRHFEPLIKKARAR